MNKDIENRVKKMIDKKESNILYLKKIENKQCLEIILYRINFKEWSVKDEQRKSN